MNRRFCRLLSVDALANQPREKKGADAAAHDGTRLRRRVRPTSSAHPTTDSTEVGSVRLFVTAFVHRVPGTNPVPYRYTMGDVRSPHPQVHVPPSLIINRFKRNLSLSQPMCDTVCTGYSDEQTVSQTNVRHPCRARVCHGRAALTRANERKVTGRVSEGMNECDDWTMIPAAPAQARSPIATDPR